MNDQLQQALAVVLQGATNAVQSGVSFLKAELPDVIHQLLVWKLAQNLIIGIAALVLVVLAADFVRRAATAKTIGLWRERSYMSQDTGPGDWTMFAAFGTMGAIIAAFIGSVFVMISAMAAVQIWLAPKIYLIEYAARLAGK